MTTYTGLSFLSMQKLLPILALLDGLAVQREQVKSFAMDGGDVVEIRFPAMLMRRVKAQGAPNGYAWALCYATGDILTILIPN